MFHVFLFVDLQQCLNYVLVVEYVLCGVLICNQRVGQITGGFFFILYCEPLPNVEEANKNIMLIVNSHLTG